MTTRRCVMTVVWVAGFGWSPPVHAFCNNLDLSLVNDALDLVNQEPIDLECTEAGHGAAHRELSFLRPGVLASIWMGNIEQDLPGFLYGNAALESAHFDSCRFPESTERIRSLYTAAIGGLDPATPDLILATLSFGRLLHPVQDFYAHSNYVELLEGTYGPWGYVHPEFLLDTGTGPFRPLEPLSLVPVSYTHLTLPTNSRV